MPPLFWIDIIGLSISILITCSLTISVLGVDLKNPIYLSFGLFTGSIALWTFSALLLRLSLWLGPLLPTPLFLFNSFLWIKLTTIFLSLTSILSLLFTVIFLDRRTRYSDWALIVSFLLFIIFLVIGLSTTDVFIKSVTFDSYGLIRHEKSRLAWILLGIWGSFIIWSLVLFWQERHRSGAIYLAFGMLILLLGLLLRIVIFLPFPFISFSNSTCAFILAYGVISKQLFNPLKARTIELNNEIEERKEAEKAIVGAQQRYHSLYNSKTNLVFIIDKNGNIVDANDLSLNIFGYEKEELARLNYMELAHPDQDLEPIAKVITEILETSVQVETLELKMRSKTGETIYIKVGGTLILGKNEIIEVAQDITKQKVAEAALRKSEVKYRSILETIEDGYYEVDKAGNFTYFNDSLCRILGYNKSELLGVNFREYTNDEGAQKLYKIFNSVFITGVPKSEFSWEIIRKDGTKGFAEVSVSIRNDEEGQAIGFRGIARDVTDQKKLEVEFQQAQKMESIGTLAGGIAHNFNNVLMGIQGRTSLMTVNKDPSNPDVKHLKEIESYVKNAVELTKDLLGFARRGKYEVNPTDLNTLIKHENDMFSRTKKEIQISAKYEKGLWAAEVDRGQIQQVLLNLYVNAWQAMPGGGSLYIQTENATLTENFIRPFQIPPGRYVKISVTDNGIGMDETTQEKIFDPFFSTKETGQGTGLGLASVYGIINNHGGFIYVYSQKEEGTTFNIYLPASDKAILEENTGYIQNSIELGQGTILLVDDESMIIEVGQSMLEKLGYHVMAARNGKEALEIYVKQKNEIDLIILDMIMPGMGGGEIYDRLKEIDKDVKVLLSSGYSINGQAEEIMKRGCKGFIQKPFSLNDLSNRVKKILNENRE